MKNLLTASAAFIALFCTASCQDGWGNEYQSMYLEACSTSGNALKLDSTDRDTYCKCSLDKVMKQYPDMEDAIANKDSTQMSAALEDCMRAAIK